MSEKMDVLLADGRRLQERRAAMTVDPAPKRPATRAEQIIHEGFQRRHFARCGNLEADTAAMFGVQIGYLHEQVKKLCAELDEFNVKRTDGLTYFTLPVKRLGGDVLIGFRTVDGPISVEIEEVFVNGRNIAAGLCEDLAQELIDTLQAAQPAQVL